jgi:hypothetical protein
VIELSSRARASSPCLALHARRPGDDTGRVPPAGVSEMDRRVTLGRVGFLIAYRRRDVFAGHGRGVLKVGARESR